MNQPFDALLELYKRTVVSDADDASAYVCSHRIAMLSIQPGIRRQLLKAQRNPLFLVVKFENFDLNLIAHIHQIAGVSKPAP